MNLRKLYILLLVSVLTNVIFVAKPVYGQTTKTVGAGGDYVTLKAAFDEINSGLISGEIILQLIGSTVETTTASLNASGTGNADYTSVLIYPTLSGVKIEGEFTNVLIRFDGADNVTIDGRANLAGEADLIITQNNSLVAGVRTIQFLNSAENNTIRYCNLFGSPPTASGGIIHFSTSNAGNGNSFNTIEYCNISNASGNRPYNVIYSNGSSGRRNSNTIIRNNNIYDFFSPVSNSNAINIAGNSDFWTIEGNSFYETEYFVPESQYNYYVVSINTTDANNYTIKGNYFGGSSPQCSGDRWTTNASLRHIFRGVFVRTFDDNLTIIEDNHFKQFDYTSTNVNPWDAIHIHTGKVIVSGNSIGDTTGSGSVTLKAPVAYLTSEVSGGSVTVVNIIGGGYGYTSPPEIIFNGGGGVGAAAVAELTDGSISNVNITNVGAGYTSAPTVRIQGNNTGFSTMHGILINSQSDIEIRDNLIGSITTIGSDYYSFGIEGIYKTAGRAGNLLIEGNTIGSMGTPDNIIAGSSAHVAGSPQRVYGIYLQGTGNSTISNNVVSNISNSYSGTLVGRMSGIFATSGNNLLESNFVCNLLTASGQDSFGADAPLTGIGISNLGSGSVHTIVNNEVHSLYHNHPTARVDLYGIYYRGPNDTFNEISGNYVHNLEIASSNIESSMDGIVLHYGKVNVFNNLIALGENVTQSHPIYGIWDNASHLSDANIYFNTVIISGEIPLSQSTEPTYALRNNSNNTAKNIRNNLFVNIRSGGVTGKHYVIRLAGTNSLTIDHNNYHAPDGIIGFLLSDRATLGSWQTATGQDINSLNFDPLFFETGQSPFSDYIPLAVMQATTIPGIEIDFNRKFRAATPTMGAFEKGPAKWTGITSNDWGTSSNWLANYLPETHEEIIIPGSCPDYPVLDQARFVQDINILTDASLTIPPQGNLTITGIFSNESGTSGLIIQSDATGSGSLIHNNTGVDATIERYLPGDLRTWHMISSPVSNQSIQGSVFEPGANDDLYLWYEPSPGIWVNYTNQDGSGGSPTFPQANNGNNNFATGHGYIANYNEVNPVKTFRGKLNAGEVNIPLAVSSLKSWDWESGWNLVGNPYASSIDWDMVDKSNLAEIHAQVYDPAFGGGGYRQFTTIAPQQGFFIRAAADGNLNLTNAVQTHGGTFYKNIDEEPNDGLVIRLSKDQYYDEAKIVINPMASDEYDFYDATKLFSFNEQVPQIYSKSIEGRWLSVNSIPTIKEPVLIPLTVISNSSGLMSLNLHEIDGSFSEKMVFLLDKKNDTYHNLSLIPTYSFTSLETDDPDRFELIIDNNQFLEPSQTGNMNVFTSKDIFYLINHYEKANVEIYDLNGRLMLKKEIDEGFRYLRPMFSTGTYIVRMIAENEVLNRKVFLD